MMCYVPLLQLIIPSSVFHPSTNHFISPRVSLTVPDDFHSLINGEIISFKNVKSNFTPRQSNHQVSQQKVSFKFSFLIYWEQCLSRSFASLKHNICFIKYSRITPGFQLQFVVTNQSHHSSIDFIQQRTVPGCILNFLQHELVCLYLQILYIYKFLYMFKSITLPPTWHWYRMKLMLVCFSTRNWLSKKSWWLLKRIRLPDKIPGGSCKKGQQWKHGVLSLTRNKAIKNDWVTTSTTSLCWRECWHITPLVSAALNLRRNQIGEVV